MTIEKFIEARIAEREAELKRMYGGYRAEGYLAERLGEYAAMRAILELHSEPDEVHAFGQKRPTRTLCSIDGDRHPCQSLRILAAAWPDHEDYGRGWKP